MQLIHHFKGSLSKDFVGQIAYIFCLPDPLMELDIEFRFQKRKLQSNDDTPKLRSELYNYCKKHYEMDLSKEQMNDLITSMKTEIHTLAELNGEFIGGIHRQEEVRHMYFSSHSSSLGCLPLSNIKGSLKITLLCFNVLLEDTPYELIIRGRKEKECITD